MKLSSSRAYVSPTPVPKMPSGLAELMEGLTKEVLKNNPKDIFEFCAEHMRRLLELKDGPQIKCLSLEQKVLKANKIIRQRAENRRLKYDRDFQIYNIKQDNLSLNLQSVKDMPETVGQHGLLKSDDQSHMMSHVNENNYNSGKVNYSKDSKDVHIHKNLSEEKNLCNILKEDFPDKIKNYITGGKNIEQNENLKHADLQSLYTNEQENIEIIEVPLNIEKIEEDQLNVEKDNIEERKCANMINKSHFEENARDIEVAKEINFCIDCKADSVKVEKEVVLDAGDFNKSVKVTTEDINKEEKYCNNGLEVVKEDANLKIDNRVKNFGNEYQPNIETINNKMEKSGNYNNMKTINDLETNINFENNKFIEKTDNGSQLKEIVIKNEEENKNEVDNNQDAVDSDVTVVINISNENAAIKTDAKHTSDICIIAQHFNINSEVYQEQNSNILSDSKLKDNENHKMTLFDNNVIKNTNIQDENYDQTENKNDSEIITNSEVFKPEIEKLTIKDPNLNSVSIDSSKSQTDQNPTHQCLHSETQVTEEYANKKGENSERVVLGLKASDNVAVSFECQHDEAINNESDNKQNVYNNTLNNDHNIELKIDSNMPKAMDLETAAITIQKVFRNFLFKSKTSSLDDSSNIEYENDSKEINDYEDLNQNVNKERRTLGLNRMDTVLQTVKEEKSLSLSTDDSSTLSSAATVIQARIRGFLVRNRLNPNKTSMSLLDSDDPSSVSIEATPDISKNKTVLNIHIVPERSDFVSRDESLLTSVELSLDGSPPVSTNLQPFGYDISERRKQFKREDAIQSISPPSNNSGLLSEEHDSVKEVFFNDRQVETAQNLADEIPIETQTNMDNDNNAISLKIATDTEKSPNPNNKAASDKERVAVMETSSDESDVITPLLPAEEKDNYDSNNIRLLHSGEFHDVLLPTKVSRSDTSSVRDFQNVLVYFLVWENS